MAYGDDPDHDLYDDEYDPYEDDPEAAGDEPADDGYDDDGWGADPPARQGGLRLLVGVAALLLALGVVAALSKAGDDDPDTDEVATDESSTSSSRRTTTSGPLGLPGDPRPTVTTSGSASSTSTTARGSTSTRQPAVTVITAADEPPEPGCASGGGGAPVPAEADWAERWQTMPQPNDPATVTICVDDVTPAVGQRVQLTIVGDDPDAVFPTSECGTYITWEGSHASFCRDFVIPWGDPRPTPRQEPGHVVQHHAHVYTSPGARTITGSVWSAEYDGYTSPYSSRAVAQLPVTVHG